MEMMPHIEMTSEMSEKVYNSLLGQHIIDRLNSQQRKIFDYMMAHPRDMVVIQAGPGTGKTFTLKSIAFNARCPSTVIIYKKDLLNKFTYCAHRYTVAKFFMQMFDLNYYAYKALCDQIGSSMSPQEFIYAVMTLLNKFQPPPALDGYMMIDEYTVIPKPLLIALLIILKEYKVGTIISGDCNQLQSIQSAQNNGISSFEIAQTFSDKTFFMDRNERCPDPKYNRVMKFISKLSSNKRLDKSAHALVASVFLGKLAASSEYNDVHLAGTHRELTRLVHMYVVNEEIPVEFYLIKTNVYEEVDDAPLPEDDNRTDMELIDTSVELGNGIIQPSIVTNYINDKMPKKFLPYLPLKIGAKYYVNELTEDCIGELIEIHDNDKVLKVRMSDGTVSEVCKKNCSNMLNEMHLDAIKQRLRGGVYNYPIYPINIMTMHKCQGCTMIDPLDINLGSTTYEGLYVAISRVTHPDGIRRIVIPNLLDHMFSAIINFPEHVNPNFDDFTEELLLERFENYKYYKILETHKCLAILSEFINATTKEERIKLRKQLIELSKHCTVEILHLTRPPIRQDLLAINKFMEDYEIFKRASLFRSPADRSVWLHEYMLRNPKYRLLLQNPSCYKNNTLKYMCKIDETYPFSESTVKYIESKAELVNEPEGKGNPRLIGTKDMYYMLTETEFQKVVRSMLLKEKPRDEDDIILNDEEVDQVNEPLTVEWLCSILPKVSYYINDKECRTAKTSLNKKPKLY